MKLYKNYCYKEISSVANAIKSEPFINPTDTITSVTHDSTDITINFTSSPSYIFTPPDCQKLGFNNSYSGMTLSESTEIGLAVAVVLLVSWSFKIARRTI